MVAARHSAELPEAINAIMHYVLLPVACRPCTQWGKGGQPHRATRPYMQEVALNEQVRL